MMFLAPVFYTGEGLPSIVQNAQKAVPLTYGVQAMRAVAVNGSGLGEIWQESIILAVLSALSLGTGYRKLEY